MSLLMLLFGSHCAVGWGCPLALFDLDFLFAAALILLFTLVAADAAADAAADVMLFIFLLR